MIEKWQICNFHSIQHTKGSKIKIHKEKTRKNSRKLTHLQFLLDSTKGPKLNRWKFFYQKMKFYKNLDPALNFLGRFIFLIRKWNFIYFLGSEQHF
jgi:hypothetical protein